MINNKALKLYYKLYIYIIQEIENIKHKLSEKELENYRT